jgi:hypothetical protein
LLTQFTVCSNRLDVQGGCLTSSSGTAESARSKGATAASGNCFQWTQSSLIHAAQRQHGLPGCLSNSIHGMQAGEHKDQASTRALSIATSCPPALGAMIRSAVWGREDGEGAVVRPPEREPGVPSASTPTQEPANVLLPRAARRTIGCWSWKTPPGNTRSNPRRTVIGDHAVEPPPCCHEKRQQQRSIPNCLLHK